MAVILGAHKWLLCAPGRTNIAGLCSCRHKHSLVCAPGTTGLCSRENKYCLHVLAGAQVVLDCAPWGTHIAFFELPRAQSSTISAPAMRCANDSAARNAMPELAARSTATSRACSPP